MKRLIPRKEITNRPAKTRGTSSLELAAIIKYPVPSLLAAGSICVGESDKEESIDNGLERGENSYQSFLYYPGITWLTVMNDIAFNNVSTAAALMRIPQHAP